MFLVLIRSASLSNKVPHRGVSNEFLQVATCFHGKIRKNITRTFGLQKKHLIKSICIDIVLLSPQKLLLWVLIRSALPRHF